MIVRFDGLRTDMVTLRDAVSELLSAEDHLQVTGLINANEFGVALEWMLDSLAEMNSTLPRAAFELVERLAKQMNMYPGVLERLPADLVRVGSKSRGNVPMLIGNKDGFGIESEIAEAYERLSFRGLGFFLIHILGAAYGVRSKDATLLACSFDQVGKRLEHRGQHIAPFASFPDGGAIATAARMAIYSYAFDPTHLGLSREELTSALLSNSIIWAPDGDEAFDGGSNILQFDVGDRVRIIGSKWTEEGQSQPSDLRDLWLPAAVYYDVLATWRSRFEREWESTPKARE